ncbi:MAG: BTAD domain-containing putative transcriptional regulator [Acidimicrobiales bacterium]
MPPTWTRVSRPTSRGPRGERPGDLAAARDRLATALGLARPGPVRRARRARRRGGGVAGGTSLHAVEEHAEVSLTLGLHRELVADLEAAVHEAPHRERLWEHLMLALYRSSRQADALATYQRARRRLGEDLGIDPGLGLRKLEAAILDQDPALDLDPNGVGPASVADPDDPGDTYRAPAQARCRLVLEDGTERPLDGLITIGRHPECAVCLPDPAVSRRHAELRPALGGFLLVDLGSSNGTLVNDGPAVHHMLVDGDLIGIGAHRLTYRSEPAKRLGSSDL